METSLEALETSLKVAAVETSLELQSSLEALETSLEVAAVTALHNHCPAHYDDLEIE